jgi:hypothetical protein
MIQMALNAPENGNPISAGADPTTNISKSGVSRMPHLEIHIRLGVFVERRGIACYFFVRALAV